MITKRAVERHINSIFWKLDLRESEDVSRRVKAVLMYLGARCSPSAAAASTASLRLETPSFL